MPVGVVTTQQGNDIGPTINRLAEREQMDARGFLGLLIAESNLDETARRPRNPAQDAAYWPDVSGGLGQQTVLYADAFGLGDGSGTRANIDAVMARLMDDVAFALDIAAEQWGAHYRRTGSWQTACAKYNGGPGATWDTIPANNRTNYERGYAAAAAYIQEAPVDPNDLRQRYMRALETNAGTPYEFGGKTPGHFDCSGLLTYTARQVGGDLGDPVMTSADGLKGYCDPVDLGEVLPGDLLLFSQTYGDGGPDYATHCGASYGAGTLRMFDTHGDPLPGCGVTDISAVYWQVHLMGAWRPRMFTDAPPPDPPPEPPPINDRVAELETQLGFLMVNCGEELQRQVDALRGARTLKAVRAIVDAGLQPVVDTVKRGGAPAEGA